MSRRWRKYLGGMAAVSFVVLVVTLVVFVQVTTDRAIAKNNRSQCPVLESFTEAPPRPPVGQALTPVGEDIQRYNRELAERQARQLAKVKKLIHDYHC